MKLHSSSMWHELKYLLIIWTIVSSHLHWSILYDWCLLVHIILHFFKRIRPRIYLWNFAAKNKLWKHEGPHNTHSRVYTRNFRPLILHSFSQTTLSFSPLKILKRAKIEFWTLGRLKTKKIKINKNQIEKKRKGNI